MSLHDEVRRATRNLLLTNGLLLLGLALLVLGTWAYWDNVWRGPTPISRETLVGLKSTEGVSRYFVTVRGDRAEDSGYSVFKDGKKDWAFTLLLMGDRVLLVKGFDEAPRTEYSGVLHDPGDDKMVDEIRQRLAAEDPQLASAMLPVYLSADAFQDNGKLVTWLLAAVALVLLWNVARGLARWQRPSSHPGLRALSRLGSVDEVVAQVDADLAREPLTVVGNLTLSPSWLVSRSTFGVDVMATSEVVWLYKNITQHTYNGVPTGKDYSAVIWGEAGNSLTVQGKIEQVDQMLVQVAERAPWAILGYDDRFAESWKTNRPQVVANLRASYEVLAVT